MARSSRGPLQSAEDIIFAEIDDEGLSDPPHYDAVGLYSRSAILRLVVDREPKPMVIFLDRSLGPGA
jgi:hypothetical protein